MYLRSHYPSRGCGRRRGNDLFGLATEEMSPVARTVTGGAVISAVLLSAVFLLAFVPQMWWLVTIYGWTVFPAFRAVASGASGKRRRNFTALDSRDLPVEREAVPSPISGERQILEALERVGELTPTRAALETSLSVAEAEKLLAGLSDGGHLEVRVRDGGIFYSMWRADG